MGIETGKLTAEGLPKREEMCAAEKAAQGELAEGGTKKRKKAKKSSDNEVAVEAANGNEAASNGATEEADNEPTTDVADQKKTVETAEGEASDTKQPAVDAKPAVVKKAANKKTKPSKPVSLLPEKKMNVLLMREEEIRIKMRNEYELKQGFNMPRRPRMNQPFSKHFIRGKADKLVMRRHKEVYPSEAELKKLQKLVVFVEQCLKKVAEKIEREGEKSCVKTEV